MAEKWGADTVMDRSTGKGPKYCPMHNFRDVDWTGLRGVVATRKRARQVA